MLCLDEPFCNTIRDEEGDRLDFASALIAALLANKPLDVFKIDENLSFAAFKGLPLWLLPGDLGGVVDSSGSIDGLGFETEMPLNSNESPAFLGDRIIDVETDLA